MIFMKQFIDNKLEDPDYKLCKDIINDHPNDILNFDKFVNAVVNITIPYKDYKLKNDIYIFQKQKLKLYVQDILNKK